jgi:putative transposase
MPDHGKHAYYGIALSTHPTAVVPPSPFRYDSGMRLPDGRVRKLRRSSDDATAAHALTFSCWRRQPFLSRERPCLWLASAIDRARRRFALDVWAYVFMPNHVHLILHAHAGYRESMPPTDAFRLAAILAAIKLPVTRRAVAWVTREAPAFLPNLLDAQPSGTKAYRFWQRGGGYDRDLHDPGTIHATIDYIHANPVRAGLVEQPEEWRWSSAAYFAGTGTPALVPDVDSIPSPPRHWRFQSCGS